MQDDSAPVHYAASDKYIKTLEALLKHKADLNARNKVVSGRRVVVCVYLDAALSLSLTHCHTRLHGNR